MSDSASTGCQSGRRIQIAAAQGAAQRTALRLLLNHLPVPEREEEITRLQQSAADGSLSLQGLLLATCADRPVGAVLFLLQPDGCGFVWPPHVVPPDEAGEVADCLLSAVVRELDAAGVWLGQCVLDPDALADRRVLTRNGFPHLTNLHYLQRDLTDLPRGPHNRPESKDGGPVEEGLSVEVVHPDQAGDRLAKLIERTYIDSLDCPALNGVRNGREAMATHRTTGVFLPEGWLIFREAGRDVGVLLFADQPEQNAWELAYMGVVPEARGRGIGRKMLQYGLQLAARSPRRFVLLAVDEDNCYARALYASAGFVPLSVKAVHVRLGAGGRRCG